MTVSSFATSPCSLGPLWSVLPPVGGSSARGSLVTLSAGSFVCGCCVLTSAPTVSYVGAAWCPCGVGSGSIVTVVIVVGFDSIITVVIGSSGFGLMGGYACTITHITHGCDS